MVVRLDEHETFEKFSEIIDHVHDGGEIVVIARADKPMAVIVPVEFFERYTDMIRGEQIEPDVLREATSVYGVEEMLDDAPRSRATFRTAGPITQDAETLAGAFPALAYLSDEDMDWAKQQWERGMEKQIELLTQDAGGH